MIKITQTRGHWTATVSGMGTLPVLNASDLQRDALAQCWRTHGPRDTTLAQKQFDAVIRQLTAGNPDRRVRAVLAEDGDVKSSPVRRLFEFTLAKVQVDRFRNGTARFDYQLTNGQELTA
ncbi:hypothetical protein R3X27_24170 [Tropicimonas sp. TH_r6]|uniref:hypothetical protein n=1 Tax=Tropicimonas sp. TH_r6 TaxID=3082085 RepID=UPI0029541502|nr:hypothetical protein [Tropicimonas sp. TH_r6]MDV7145786.1 hypothetical protein [Tropicimonas sp. TH_r6]